MKISKIAVTLLMSSVLFTGCGFKNSQAVIKINDGVITQKQIDDLIDKQVKQSPLGQLTGGDMKKDKEGFLYLMTEQRVVNQLIIEEILNQEIKARGITASQEEVDQAIKDIMDKMGGKDRLMEVIKQNNISVSGFKKDVKEQVKMRKLAAAAGSTEVSEKEAKDFYNKNLKSFKHDEQVRASHILIAFNPDQLKEELSSNPKKSLSEEEINAKIEKISAEKKELAEKIAKELQADPSKFEQYVKKYSEDPGSAQQGGDLGFFDKGRMVPEFSNAVFASKPNSAPAVVKTPFGYHVYIVTDRMEAGVVPFEKARADIEGFLKNQKEVKILDDIVSAAKKKSTIEFIDDSYNPETINKKLHNQVNDMTNGAKDKFDQAEAAKKAPEKK